MINRKNTILLAVLINAGLLLVLFVTALTSKDETPAAPTTEPVLAEAAVPLFGDELMSKSQDLVAMAPIPVAPAAAPVMHALPPVASEPIPVPVMAPPAVVVPEVPVAAAPRVQEVIVRKGETLDKIAKAHRTTVDEIIKLNHLSSSFLRVGQIVKVPGEKSVAPKAVAVADKGSDYYIVKVGDNPWTIAMKHHMKVEELLRLNGMNEQKAKKLKAGDRLRVRKEQ